MHFPVAHISYSKDLSISPSFPHTPLGSSRKGTHIYIYIYRRSEKCFFSASVGKRPVPTSGAKGLFHPRQVPGRGRTTPQPPWGGEREKEALGSAQDLSLGRIKGCVPTTWQTLADGVPYFFWFPCHERRPAAFVYIERPLE